jgi:hypothetical protein
MMLPDPEAVTFLSTLFCGAEEILIFASAASFHVSLPGFNLK